jgi:DNA-binding transcriptional MerR regulator
MKINEAMKETGLTKKAIYYYEEMGLLSPEKETGSNYRIYSAADVKRLINIHALRQLDFSIRDIQLLLSGKQNTAEIIKRQFDTINSQIKMLNKSKEILESLVEADASISNDEVMASIRSLGISSRKMAGFMQKELNRILPGNLGKMFAVHYGQFLDGPLDTKEKENAWHGLINLLDSQEEIQYGEDMKELIDEMFGRYNDDELAELGEKARIVTDRILEHRNNVSTAEKSEIAAKLEAYEKTPKYQKDLKLRQFMLDNLVPIFKDIDQYLCILSPRFKTFNKILREGSGVSD